jgi:glycosyltransferase involved in cell wall biosynthesis
MPKLLYFATEDWAFHMHFLPMARAARAAGCDVVVAARLRHHADGLAAAGLRVVSLENERRSLAPIEIVRSLLRMVAIVRSERPDIVHLISLRMAVLGGLAARLAGAKALVIAPTGLGHLWIEDGFIQRVGRAFVRLIVGRWLNGPGTRYLFENPEDPREFGLDPGDPAVTIVGGAGVDPVEFRQLPEPPLPPLKVAVVARMVATKGIAETVAAVRLARERGAPLELHLFGAPDPSNRRAISDGELRRWAAEPGICWHGLVTDIARIWAEHHVAILLTYREGLPRSLVEAAAVGRPIVATDVVGCREVVRDGIEGFLVPLGDIKAAAGALVRLAQDEGLRARLGAAGHRRFCERFTQDAVQLTVGTLYGSMLGKPRPKG